MSKECCITTEELEGAIETLKKAKAKGCLAISNFERDIKAARDNQCCCCKGHDWEVYPCGCKKCKKCGEIDKPTCYMPDWYNPPLTTYTDNPNQIWCGNTTKTDVKHGSVGGNTIVYSNKVINPNYPSVWFGNNLFRNT